MSDNVNKIAEKLAVEMLNQPHRWWAHFQGYAVSNSVSGLAELLKGIVAKVGLTVSDDAGVQAEFRKQWAEYFDARARTSRQHGHEYPQHSKEWFHKALIEEECAIILRMLDRPLSQLFADLSASSPQPAPVAGKEAGAEQPTETVDSFFAETAPYTVAVGDADDSRQSIYGKEAGAMPKWIPIKDELPPIMVDVAVFAEGHVESWWRNPGQTEDFIATISRCRISHWMPQKSVKAAQGMDTVPGAYGEPIEVPRKPTAETRDVEGKNKPTRGDSQCQSQTANQTDITTDAAAMGTTHQMQPDQTGKTANRTLANTTLGTGVERPTGTKRESEQSGMKMAGHEPTAETQGDEDVGAWLRLHGHGDLPSSSKLLAYAAWNAGAAKARAEAQARTDLLVGIIDVCAYLKIPQKLDPPVPWNVAVKIFHDRAIAAVRAEVLAKVGEVRAEISEEQQTYAKSKTTEYASGVVFGFHRSNEIIASAFPEAGGKEGK